MFIDKLLSQGPAPMLEQMLRFTEARQDLLADDIANVDTPDYRQKDLSTENFQQMLAERSKAAETASPGSVRYDDIGSEVENPSDGILSHDGNNRSMEQLMTDNAKNALMHNLVVELLRRQYQTLDMALKERAS
jgi:flagellar basal-body rod protein FlgB